MDALFALVISSALRLSGIRADATIAIIYDATEPAALPRSWKLFCPSMSTLKPPFSQLALRLCRSAVWLSSHSAWLKSDGVLVQFRWLALN